MNSSRVLYWFEQICAIPHGSANTTAISIFCAEAGRRMGLEVVRDSHNNVIIIKPASVGRENDPAVMLQGHMDMVCEKEDGVDIDMNASPIRLKNDGEFLYAEGTTLGGDDGIGVAIILAILEDNSLSHPRIEAVFTDGEEIGMLGAGDIDLSGLQSKTVLNLDSEDEGVFLSGCAGGVSAKCTAPILRETKKGIKCTVAVGALTGGHSGIEIHRERGNACTLLGRFLSRLENKIEFGLISLMGGSKDNAIPRSAAAQIIISENDIEPLTQLAEEYDGIFKSELSERDAGVNLTVSVGSREEAMVMTGECGRRALIMTQMLPNGVIAMSPHISGLVETSLNLGIMQTDNSQFVLSYSVRSSVDSEKRALTDKMEQFMNYIGGNMCLAGDYPAWEYSPDSPIRSLICGEYEKMTGKKARIEAIHAGVECGIIGKKLGGADMVSYGPNIYQIHTPSERLEIKSALRIYELTVRVLEKIKGE